MTDCRSVLRPRWTTHIAARVVTPVSVTHREFAKGELITENLFRYSPFKKFGAEAELKFEVDEK